MSAQELLERLGHLAEPGAVLHLPGQIHRYRELPAEVLELRERRGFTEAELERRARRAAPDPSIFDEAGKGLYTFPGTICTSNPIECYSLQMRPSSLERFAAQAEEGRVLHIQHERDDSPLGRSITGTFIPAQGRRAASALADFYITRGLSLVLRSGQGGFLSFGSSAREVSTDTYVDLIRAGHYPDLSVGFIPGRVLCSIDGLDLRPRTPPSWHDPDAEERKGEARCLHLPGYEYYPVDRKTGQKAKEKVRALGLIEDADLMETSIVDDGAAPGAVIGSSTAGLFRLKAQLLADAAELEPEVRDWFERQYRCRIYTHDRFWGGFSPIEETARQLELLAEPIARRVLSTLGLAAPERPDEPEPSPEPETPETPVVVNVDPGNDPETAAETIGNAVGILARTSADRPAEEVGMDPEETGNAGQATQTTPPPGPPARAASVDPARIAELERQAAEATELRERLNKLEAEQATQARTARAGHFRALTRGRADDKIRDPWPGEPAEHVEFMEWIAALPTELGGGPESPRLAFYVKLNQLHASQIAASQAFSVAGRDGTGPESGVWPRIVEMANELRAREPGLSEAKAIDRVLLANPSLQAEYHREQAQLQQTNGQMGAGR